MKKHFFQIFLFLVGITMFTSCMKDDPENNQTVYYGYQQIPNINDFMPHRLLQVMDSLNCLHYGDEPPRIDGSFLADSIWTIKIIKTPTSPWLQSGSSPMVGETQYFKFYEQHKGIAKLQFKSPHFGVFLERSDPDTTYSIVTDNPGYFIDDTIAPVYFKNGNYQKDNFNTVYIIGNAPFFTAYYYEVRDVSWKGQPLNAVIVSGEMDEDQQVIKNLTWGMESMVHYNHTPIVDQILQQGMQMCPGDIRILCNYRDARLEEYHE